MSRSTIRIRLLLSAVFLAAMAGPGPARVPAYHRPVTPRGMARPQPVIFAHTQSDLAVDPGARFGRLPNGMGYVIYKHKTPPGAAAVWMRVGAGSVMEQQDQRGLAHFLEHMAFNGSKNVPEGEMIRLLQRDGLQFGADTNAQTSAFQTVYMLNLPDATTPILNDALLLMRETAGNMSLAPAAIDRERGVILGEERARATVESRAREAWMKRLMPGAKYPERLPIGLVDVIKTAQRPALQRFYTDFYRPENATLIVVGDVDPDQVNVTIRRLFADWRPAPASAAARTDYGRIAGASEPQAGVYTAPGLRDQIMISWIAPPADEIETKAKDARDLLADIPASILNERFARAANAPGTALAAASFAREPIKHTAQVRMLALRPLDGRDEAAFDQALGMLRDFVLNGPTQAELDRALLNYGRAFRDQAAGARTMPSAVIVGQIAQSIDTMGVLQSPAQQLEEFEALKPGFTVAAIRQALKNMRLDGPALLWRQGEKRAPFDEDAMLKAYRRAFDAPVKALVATEGTGWPYTNFGTPTEVLSRAALPDIGATRVTFANGVVLTVKQTSFEDDAVYVSVQLGNGLYGIGPDQGASLFLARQLGLLEGGLGKLPVDDIRDRLVGKNYGLQFTIGNNATILSGRTSTKDLATQMQLMAAAVTDPGLRPDALARAKAALPPAYADGHTSPDGVYAMEASGDPYDDDARFSTPPLAAALAVRNEDIAALVKDQLGHGPVDITIVGDITPDEAIRQVGATFGALPPMPAAIAQPQLKTVHFPHDNLRRVYTHSGRPDQNLSVVIWPTDDYYADPRQAQVREVLAAVLTSREFDEVREKQGASYSASARSTSSRNFDGLGFITSRALVRPEGDDTYRATLASIIDDLRKTPITPDELRRARQPLIDRLRSQKSTNGYWLAMLSGTLRDPRQITAAEAVERDLQSVTAADIQAAARRDLDMDKALRIQIKPAAVAGS